MIRMIAFDFDGTLAESVAFCLEIFDRVFAEYLGERAPSHEKLFSHFGQNEIGILQDELGKRLPEAEARFFQLHRQLHPQYVPAPFPGVRELLLFLHERGIQTAFLSGRSELTGEYSLDYLKLKSFFLDFQFGSAFGNEKAGQLRNLMRKYSLLPGELVYVGDSVSDVTACREAGVVCFSAAWAKSADYAALEALNPGLVFRTLDALKCYWLDHSLL